MEGPHTMLLSDIQNTQVLKDGFSSPAWFNAQFQWFWGRGNFTQLILRNKTNITPT